MGGRHDRLGRAGLGPADASAARPPTPSTPSTRALPQPLSHAPLPTSQIIYTVGVLKKRPPLPPRTPSALARLIAACWAADPADRPPFGALAAALESEFAAVGDGV